VPWRALRPAADDPPTGASGGEAGGGEQGLRGVPGGEGVGLRGAGLHQQVPDERPQPRAVEDRQELLDRSVVRTAGG